MLIMAFGPCHALSLAARAPPRPTGTSISFRRRCYEGPVSTRYSRRRRTRTRSLAPDASWVEPVLGVVGLDSLLSWLDLDRQAAVLASALFATVSVVLSLWGGIITESKRAQLQLELEEQRQFQQELQEAQGMMARFRGPLLEAASILEQRIWHLLVDERFEEAPGEREVQYIVYCLAHVLGYIEVVRRESPRQLSLLKGADALGDDTLSSLTEAVRFVLSSSPQHLQEWYAGGADRAHPGARTRRSRQELLDLVEQRQLARLAGTAAVGLEYRPPEEDLLRISRGDQRAIGNFMMLSEVGSERHQVMTYGDWHNRMEDDPRFAAWFNSLEADFAVLLEGGPWAGEEAFPVGRWTRVLLLQQLLVEMLGVLDPDCVRVPLSRRVIVAPVAWAKLPGLTQYQLKLQELVGAMDYGSRRAALAGLKRLAATKTVDEQDGAASGLSGMLPKLPGPASTALGAAAAASAAALVAAAASSADRDKSNGAGPAS